MYLFKKYCPLFLCKQSQKMTYQAFLVLATPLLDLYGSVIQSVCYSCAIDFNKAVFTVSMLVLTALA